MVWADTGLDSVCFTQKKKRKKTKFQLLSPCPICWVEPRQWARKEAARNGPVVASRVSRGGGGQRALCVLARACISASTGLEPSAWARVSLPHGGGISSQLQGRLKQRRD